MFLGNDNSQGYEPCGLITIHICYFLGQNQWLYQKLIDILIHALLVLSQLLEGHEETYKLKRILVDCL